MNNMVILRLLSEEVFEFGTGMTSARAIHLKQQFCHEFEGVHKLCRQVLVSLLKYPVNSFFIDKRFF